MITQIYHKRNDLFEVKFFEDAECTVPFDFTGKKNLYIELLNGDCTPVLALSNRLWNLGIKTNIFTPIWYLGFYDWISPQTPVITLNDVLCNDELQNVNLSKYIPEDNAVLVLSEEHIPYSDTQFSINFQMHYPNFEIFKNSNDKPKKLTIFLHQGTQSELQKAEEVAKYLWESFRIKPDLFMLHCFIGLLEGNRGLCYSYDVNKKISALAEYKHIKKAITTNSTGILKAKDSTKRLQVIDSKEIFEEYLKENN